MNRNPIDGVSKHPAETIFALLLGFLNAATAVPSTASASACAFARARAGAGSAGGLDQGSYGGQMHRQHQHPCKRLRGCQKHCQRVHSCQRHNNQQSDGGRLLRQPHDHDSSKYCSARH